MSAHAHAHDSGPEAAPVRTAPARLLQRKCACGGGGAAGLTGGCGKCADKQKRPLQTKLEVGRADDHFELEADRLAEEVMRGPSHAAPHPAAPALQRRAVTPAGPASSGTATAPPSVEQALDAPGQPLDAPTRTFMEARFGHDFGRVRVHADARAAESARAVNASAYTVGNNIAFDAGRYAPHTDEGRRLIAHELTHVLQQQGGPASPPVLRRKTGNAASAIGGFFSSLFFGVLGIANVYPEALLRKYLQKLDETNDIEGDSDSDDKAQQIALEWRKGSSPFVLTAHRKALLIRELLDGPTSPGDEEAIIELLVRSYNHELSYIFGPGGVTAKRLAEDIADEPGSRIYEFFYNRFEGGHKAVFAGNIKPEGRPPVTLGVELPEVGATYFHKMPFKGGKVGWTVPCVLDILCTRDRPVVEKLPRLNVKVMDKIEVTRWAFDGKAWKSEVGQAVGVNKPDLKLVGIRADRDCNQAAQTIFHEVHHQTQGHDVRKTRYTMEVDAYTVTEKWAISRGLPDSADESDKSLRKTDASGVQTPSDEAIDKKVRVNYGGPAGSGGEEVVGHEGPATTVVELPNGKREKRPSQPDDRYLEDPPKITNEQKLDPNGFVCPDEPKKKQK